jgi:predicted glycoside hydrolase/deacetylase ChbG (UPF0249 family)
MQEPRAVQRELDRQLEAFVRLTGGPPTHIDSHHHAHRRPHLIPVFRELVEPLRLPLRGESGIRFVGGFYAQWQQMVTNLEHVSVPTLQRILRNEVNPGWTELACHPGYVSPDFASEYSYEREAELRTLTAPEIRDTIERLAIRLASYADYRPGQPS